MSFFKVDEQGEAVIIRCPEAFGRDATLEFQTLTLEWLRKRETGRQLVLDFSRTRSVDTLAYQPLTLFHQGLRRLRSRLGSVGLSPTLLAQVHRDGMDSILAPVSSLDELVKVHTHTGKLTETESILVQQLVTATVGTLQLQTGIQTQARPAALKDEKDAHEVDIAGLLGLNAETFHGTLALCFPAGTFLKLYEKLLGESHASITPEMEDAAGEVLNMIYGQIKAELNGRPGFSLQKAIPTIVRGKSLRVHQQGKGHTLKLPFDSEVGEFHIELTVGS